MWKGVVVGMGLSSMELGKFLSKLLALETGIGSSTQYLSTISSAEVCVPAVIRKDCLLSLTALMSQFKACLWRDDEIPKQLSLSFS